MENKVDYQVEGCWASKKHNTKCRLCGTKLVLVPREGHYNSKYWAYEKDDGTVLVCCPKDCDEKLAVIKIRQFVKISGYCTAISESWDYKLDYNKIHHAWIDKKGRVYPVPQRGHVDFAFDRGKTEGQLENRGWLKLTSREFFWRKKLSKRQIDTLFDYILVVGKPSDVKKFKDIIDDEIGILKINKGVT